MIKRAILAPCVKTAPLVLLTVMLVSMSAPPAAAVPLFFTNRAAFDAAAGGGLAFEDFEADFAVAASVAFAGFTVSETNGINALGQLRDFSGLVNGITGGTGGLVYDDNGSSIATFFNFTIPVRAFGIDITSNPGGVATIGGSVSDSLVLVTNSPQFWGVIDFAGITSISFDVTGEPNVGFDSASYGTPVPEPASLLLFGTGLLACGRRLRRSQRS
jgi:hypothetical protein